MTIRALVVEDQYFARLALHTVIDSRSDMKIVAETDHGSEAAALYEEHRPDIAIVDLRLPGVSGFDVIRQIRAAHPKARILVLSNYDRSEDVYRALQAGASAYLTKDAAADELVAAILAVQSGRKYLPQALAGLLADRYADDELTDREIQVIELLAEGLSNKAIADRLGIAEKTVRTHMGHILDKLGAKDRTQALLTAIRRGLIHVH